MAVYALEAEFRAHGIQTDDFGTASVDALLDAASRIVDRLAGVPANFFAPSDDTINARTFYGDGTAYLRLDPYKNAETPTLAIETDYDLPENIIFTGVEGRQFAVANDQTKRLDLSEYNSSAGRFEGWPLRAAVTVTTKWGFTSLLPDVKAATIELALHTWRKADPARFGVEGDVLTLLNSTIPPTTKLITSELYAEYARTAFAT